MEKGPKNLLEQKELPTPRPGLLDVIIINERLAQVGPDRNSVKYLDEEIHTEEREEYKIPWHTINWNEYKYEEMRDIISVCDLRERKMISQEEYMRVHWGGEEERNPYFRDGVTFFGEFKKKK